MKALITLILFLLLSVFPTATVYKELRYQVFSPSVEPGNLHIYAIDTSKFKFQIKNEYDIQAFLLQRDGKTFDTFAGSDLLKGRLKDIINNSTLIDIDVTTQEVLFKENFCNFMLLKIDANNMNETYELNKNEDNIFLSNLYDIECLGHINQNIIQDLFLE
jgi:hypothetical protein